MDISKMNAKAILKNWKQLNALLSNYELELENGNDDKDVVERYKSLKLVFDKVKNAVDALPQNLYIIVDDIYFKEMTWTQACYEEFTTFGTINRRLKSAYKIIDELLLL
ncbi:MAG: hypothetical protein IIW54_15590 [Lachnospiraceae bacterium]|nr:hypothetical protein [Lachnospiraceae bacterium]